VVNYKVKVYQDLDGSRPYRKWMDEWRDPCAKVKITARINRVKIGNLGDYKSVGGGVLELRVHYGPGYRVFFGIDRKEIVILLCGSDKSDQIAGIEKAKELWNCYKQEKK
jgi:putative addiction module killer protein